MGGKLLLDAVVLGGGTLKKGKKTLCKGEIKIGGKLMIEYVVDQLRMCSFIKHIFVTIPPSVSVDSWAQKVDKVIYTDGTMLENLFKGLREVKSEKVLILSSDIPLITSEAIKDFLERCKLKRADGYYPIVPKEEMNKRFPLAKRTYATVREGTFTGGNLIFVNPKILLNNELLVNQFYSLRKSPLRLAKVLGFKFLLKFFFKRLTITEAEERLSSLVNAKIIAVITPYPEVGLDVDKEEDLKLVQDVMANWGEENESKDFN